MTQVSPHDPAKLARSSARPWLIAILLLVGLPLIPGVFVMNGCVRGKGAMTAHLESLRGRPPVPQPAHGVETRAALEELSRAERVEVDVPSSYFRGSDFTTWCSSGRLRVRGREVPFGIVFEESDAVRRIADMSLSRLRCESSGRRGGTTVLR